MKRTAIVLLIYVLTFSSAAAQERPSHEYYETMFTEFIQAMNSEDTEAREACLKAYYLMADTVKHVNRWQGHFRRFHSRFGNVDVHAIKVDYPQAVTGLVQVDGRRALHEWIDLSLHLSEDTPGKFWSLDVQPARDPALQLPDRPLTTAEIARYVDEYVRNMVERDVFSGTVLLARDGEPFYSSAWGYANLRWQVLNKLDTKFNIGSMNKMFTGVAICQLAEQGKLTFDDYVIDHMPDYPNEEFARSVTIHHLLTHTSGMGSYWKTMFQMDWTKLRSVEDFWHLTIDDSLAFEPGAHFQYSNSGPVVLGMIIQEITGMDYHDYIRENVTGPAGMANTDCYHNDHIIPNLALGYFWAEEDDTIRTSNIFEHSARGGPAGGGYSTVEDFLRFSEALLNGALLSDSMTAVLTTGKIRTGPDEQYAYLFADADWNGHRVIGHGGGAPGINADLKIFPELGFTIAAMSNYGQGASAIARFAGDLIAHQRTGAAANK